MWRQAPAQTLGVKMRQQKPRFLAHFGKKRRPRRFAPNKNEHGLQPLEYDALMLNTTFAAVYRNLPDCLLRR